MSQNGMNILDLPNIVLLEIFEYLTYDEVSKKRQICRRFDQICQQVLNGGFNKAIKQHTINFKRIKALLPRRESERRNHCLARHADILTSIETRISMLSMTYAKYMDLNLCCFIPGRVLDEVFRILRLISKSGKPLRPHEVLQELRDISSMAIEHFDEKIAHNLKKSFSDNNSSKIVSSSGFCSDNRRLAATSGLGNISFCGMGGSSSAPNLAMPSVSIYGSNDCVLEPLTHRIGLIGDRLSSGTFKPATSVGTGDQQSTSASINVGDHHHPQHPTGGCPEARSTMIFCKQLEAEYKKGVMKMHSMQQVQNSQNKRLQQALGSVAELNVQIVELKKRLEDVDAKNREISANIRHINGGASPETAQTAPLCNNPKTEAVEDSATSSTATAEVPGTSTLNQPIALESANKPNKRRCDDTEIPIPIVAAVDALQNLSSTCFKKAKIDQ